MSKEQKEIEEFIKREEEARTIKLDIGELELVAECSSASYVKEIPALNGTIRASLITGDEHEEDMWMDLFSDAIRGLDEEGLVKNLLIKYHTKINEEFTQIFIETEETNEYGIGAKERFGCSKMKEKGEQWKCTTWIKEHPVSDKTKEILRRLIREGRWL